MIELKPQVENHFVCPECNAPQPAIMNVLVQSVHVMADCICSKCQLQFYQIFPVGHNVNDQLSVSRDNAKFYKTSDTESWLFESMIKAHEGARREAVRIEKVVFADYKDVIVLNTLDYLYGHVLLKLYNAFHHLDQQKDLGLILIIPKMFEWLIPKGCAEAWIVDLKLNELSFNYECIQNFVSKQFERFNSIYLSKAYSHPEVTRFDIARLTGVKPFDLALFNVQTPTITFILREDRWWLPTRADYWLYRICRKFKAAPWAGRVLSLRQNQLVKRAIKSIRKKMPQAEFYVAGLGSTGNFSGYARDEREISIDRAVEVAWCGIYSRSHVVVGIHGSNMLLPTALAAGCVEILPEERYGNMVQDISVRYNDRKQLFFYRFADQYSAPQAVAGKVLSMINHYDIYHRNMCRNLYNS